MKRIARKLIVQVLMAITATFIAAVPSFAASTSAFNSYIKKNYSNKYGVVKAGTFSRTVKGYSNYFFYNGTVKSICGDFNNDGKNDAVAFYVIPKKENGNTIRVLKAVALTSNGSKVVKKNEVILCSLSDYYHSDTRVYLKTKGKIKYFVVQKYNSFVGVMGRTYVLGLNSAGKLSLKKYYFDPGYTSGQGLDIGISNGVKSDLRNISTRHIFESDDENAYQRVGQVINNGLSSYGISVSVQNIFFNGWKNWVIKKNSSTKQIVSIRSGMTKITGTYPNRNVTYKIVISK